MAGKVAVEAVQIVLGGGGRITSTTAGAGRGGDIDVVATRALALGGVGHPASGIIASATAEASGDAGAITVSAPRIAIASGALISGTTSGTGRGGTVVIVAGNLTIAGGAQIASSTTATGSGGNVEVTASSEIALTGRGRQITALSTGTGDAGTVSVTAPDLLLDNGAAISTEAKSANGGDIGVAVGNLLSLADAGITTSVQGAAGNGGNIVIASGLTLLDHGTIKAQAVGGNGGNITINKYAGVFVASNGSLVSASSQKGISGVVEINGITPLNGALVALSSELRSAVVLTGNSCAALANRPQSSLVEGGRGGLAQDPEASLPALYIAGRDVRLGPPVPPSPLRTDGGGELRSMLPAPARCG
jgi:large exoprotein involved in heme utilization and adhesion